ncbi:MAG: zf-TFIIB domain-containing protein [Actinobacteria bacterium]|nr:zf-TFIIB domain-containing protein [Actinomycetota bacterium]
MKCPIDGTDLLITDRSGVEIDYCPQCRGVWLDRGELDKIVDRSAGQTTPPNNDPGYYPPNNDPGYYPPSNDRGHHDRSRNSHDRNGRDQHGRNGRRRREGFLGDLFDF